MKKYESIPNENEGEFIQNVLFASDIRPVSKVKFAQFCMNNNIIEDIITKMIGSKVTIFTFLNPFYFHECVNNYEFKEFYDNNTENKKKILKY